MDTQIDQSAYNLARAIRRQETRGSSDPYSQKGGSGETGAYQFMPNTWKEWSGKYLQNPNAPMTVENQNKVAYSRIKELKDKGLTPAQIAAAWNAGEGKLKNDAWKTNVGVNKYGVKYDTPSYVKNVMNNYIEVSNENKPQTPVVPEKPKDKNNFLQDAFVSVIGRPAVRLGQAVGALGVEAFGTPEMKARLPEVIKQDVKLPLGLGTVEGQKSFGEGGGKQILGNALETASYLMPSAGVTGKIMGATEKFVAPLIPKTTKAVVQKFAPKLAGLAAGGASEGYAYETGKDLQEGQSVGKAMIPGAVTAVGALVPPLFNVGGKAISAGAKKVAPNFINSLVGANREFNKAVRFGNNPGETGIKYGIKGDTLEQVAENAAKASDEVGQLIGNEYRLPENAVKRQSYADIVEPLKQAINTAKEAPNSNKALIERLQGVTSDLFEGKDLSNMSPIEAFSLKQKIKKLMKFTGSPSDDKGVNGALNGVYGRLVTKLNNAVPKMAELNKDYGGLMSLEKAATSKAERELGKNMVGFPVKIGGIAGIISSVANGGVNIVRAILSSIGIDVLEKILSSAKVKTTIAHFLAQSTDAEVQSLIRKKTIQEQKRIIDTFNEIIKNQKLSRNLLPAPKAGQAKVSGLRQIDLPERTQSTIDKTERAKMKVNREKPKVEKPKPRVLPLLLNEGKKGAISGETIRLPARSQSKVDADEIARIQAQKKKLKAKKKK